MFPYAKAEQDGDDENRQHCQFGFHAGPSIRGGRKMASQTLEDFRLAIDFESFAVSRRSAEQMQPSKIDDRTSKIFVPPRGFPTKKSGILPHARAGRRGCCPRLKNRPRYHDRAAR
jgi:hypothetical protein